MALKNFIPTLYLSYINVNNIFKLEFEFLVEYNTLTFMEVKGKNLINELLFADDTALSFNTKNGLQATFLEGM